MVLIYVDHTVVFNLRYVQTTNRPQQKMQAIAGNFGAHPELHSKPLGHIAPAAALVDDFGRKHKTLTKTIFS